MIVKDVGGSFVVQQEGGRWGFVQLAANDYVLLPTVQGVKLHSAAHFERDGEPDEHGMVKFRAAAGPVRSLIFNIGRFGDAQDRAASFVDAATLFAGGAGAEAYLDDDEVCEDGVCFGADSE